MTKSMGSLSVSPDDDLLEGRHLGLSDAIGIGIGVGAIVVGGILALVGVAFATTGPSAVVAFVEETLQVPGTYSDWFP